MEPLFIEHTKVTPRIEFDESKHTYKISGRSIPADATVFYSAADKWAEKFSSTYSGKEFAFDIRLDHLNTGSVRSILSILTKFLKMKNRGVDVKLNWHYETEDDDIRDKGEEMSLILEHEFNYIPYTEFTF